MELESATVDDPEMIFELYRPERVSEQDWETWSRAQRRAYVNRFATPYLGLVKREGVPEWLPDRLAKDLGRESWELKTKTFAATIDELLEQIDYLDDVFGPSSYHVHGVVDVPGGSVGAAVRKHLAYLAAFLDDGIVVDLWPDTATELGRHEIARGTTAFQRLDTVLQEGNTANGSLEWPSHLTSRLKTQLFGPWTSIDVELAVSGGEVKMRNMGYRPGRSLYSRPGVDPNRLVGLENRVGASEDAMLALALALEGADLQQTDSLLWPDRPGPEAFEALRSEAPEVAKLIEDAAGDAKYRAMLPLANWLSHPALADISAKERDRLAKLRAEVLSQFRQLAQVEGLSPREQLIGIELIAMRWAQQASLATVGNWDAPDSTTPSGSGGSGPSSPAAIDKPIDPSKTSTDRTRQFSGVQIRDLNRTDFLHLYSDPDALIAVYETTWGDNTFQIVNEREPGTVDGRQLRVLDAPPGEGVLPYYHPEDSDLYYGGERRGMRGYPGSGYVLLVALLDRLEPPRFTSLLTGTNAEALDSLLLLNPSPTLEELATDVPIFRIPEGYDYELIFREPGGPEVTLIRQETTGPSRLLNPDVFTSEEFENYERDVLGIER